MGKVIVLLAIPESPLAGELAALLDGGEISHHTCSLDAPMEGKPLTVSSKGVVWEGVDLMQADAIFLEKPVFPWPQHELPPERFRKNGGFKQGVVFQRETMSLIVSAVRIAGEARRMINRPGADHLAISPSIALDHLSRDGIPVHPWRLATLASELRSEAGFVVDASGGDRRHSPTIAQANEPALVYDPFPEEAVTVLVVGGRAAGALHYQNGGQWAESGRSDTFGELRGTNEKNPDTESPARIDSLEAFPEAAELAVRTAGALELDVAAVSVRTGPAAPGVLLCEAAPDLAAWNRILQGRLAEALADHLISAASG